MGIVQINTDTTGQVNVNPRRVKIIATNTLAQVEAAGFLGSEVTSVFPLYPTDIIDMIYNYVQATNSGTYAEFLPSFHNGVITLVLQAASQSGPAVVTAAVTSATPGTVRALTGKVTESATMTSGNIVGVRGEADIASASGGFVYGVQGKVIATGTLSGSLWAPAVFGQYDISAATLTGAQLAPLWGDYGTTATAGTYAALRGIAMTNTTAAILGAQIYLYGGATNFLDLVDNNALVGPTYFVAAGTSGGSAGDAAHCAASKVLKITVNGVNYWLPLFASNS
jgi:hypothetical protein